MSIFVVILLPIFVVALVLALGGGRRPADASSRPWLKAALIVPVVLVSAMLLFGLFALFASRAVSVVSQRRTPLPPSPPMATPAHGHGDLHAAQGQVIESYDSSVHIPVEVEAPAQHAAPGGAAIRVDAPPEVAPEPAAPVDWLKTLNEQDVAQDPHTTTETFYKYIVERVAESVDNVSEEGSIRRVVGEQVPTELSNWMSTRINASDGEGYPQPKEETWVTLRWQGRTERRMTWWPRPMLKGRLEARIAGPKGTAVVTANLDEKPWLYELPASVGQAEYIVALSGEPQGSAGEAIRSARLAADRLLYPKIRRQLLGISPRDWDANQAHDDAAATLKKVAWDGADQVIRAQVRQMAQSDVGLLDQCVVRIKRPYGDEWYAAQLRNVSPEVARGVAHDAVKASDHQRQSFAGMILGLGGMTLVLGLLYLALNALTRGYFRGRLRVATAVAALLAGAVMLVLIG